MPQIPVTGLPTQPYAPTPQPEMDPGAGSRADTALAGAADRVNAAFADLDGRLIQQRRYAQASALDSSSAQAMAEARLGFENDPDPATAPARYQAAMQQLRDKTLQGIQDQAVAGMVGHNMDLRASTNFIALGRISRIRENQSQAAQVDLSNDNYARAMASAGSPQEFGFNLQQSQAQTQGAVDAGWITAEQAREKTSRTLANAILLRAPSDPAGAQGFLTANSGLMTAADQLAVSGHLRPLQRAQSTNDAVQDAVFGHTPGAAPSPMSIAAAAPIADAIHQQESGGAATSATSTNGAQGGWQIMPATFRQYAKPGESIANPADNEAVGRRIVSDLSDRFGGDPARVAVGYFSGPDNVAPPGSPTPWVRDARDGNGKSVSGYVSDVLQRLPVAVHGGAGGLPDRDEAAARVMSNPRLADDPVGQQQALLKLQRLYAINDKAVKDAQEKAQNDLSSKIITDPTNVNPDDIANNPTLSAPQKQELFRFYQGALRQTGNQKDAATYGPGFAQAFAAVHAPDGDAGRITDPAQLYGRVGPNGDLTVAGIDKLRAEIDGRRTPEGASEGEMKRAFFANAKEQISGKIEGLPFKDPKGEDLYLRFMAQALPAYDAGRKAGKPATVLLDPGNPEYIGKSIDQFKRPMSVYMKDMMDANAGGATPAAQAEPDLSTQPNIVAAYRSGRITRDVAAQALIKSGFAAGPPQVPH